MSRAALAVYGDPGSIAAAIAGLDDLAAELLRASAGQDRGTAEILTCWHGEGADAFFAAQAARARDVGELLQHLRATRGALEALGQELAVARSGLRRVIEEAEDLGLRVRDDARAVYLPANFSLLHPDALAAPEQAARLTADLTAIWWRASDAWAAAAARLHGVHPTPMPSHESLLKKIGGLAWGQLPDAAGNLWLKPLAMAKALAQSDPAAAAEWARRQKLPRLAKVAAATGKEIDQLAKVPGLRDVSGLSAVLTVVGVIKDFKDGTDGAVAVLANASSAVASSGAGAVVLALAKASPPGRALVYAGFVAAGVGYVVHWALEIEPVQRAVKNVESAVTSGFRRLAEDERAAMQRLVTAR